MTLAMISCARLPIPRSIPPSVVSFISALAEVLTSVYAQQLDSVSGQIAVHYERARLGEKAIPYYKRTVEVSIHIYANEEATASFQYAIDLYQASPQRLLDAEQEAHPTPLTNNLEAALEAWDNDQKEQAIMYIQDAITLALEYGYL